MPTYEYLCDACEHEFEQFQPITARPLRKCPACGERKLRRLIGAGGGVIFKGDGFYQTDYRSEAYKKAAKAEKEAAQPAKKDKKTDAAQSKTKTPSASTPPKPDKKKAS